MSRNILFLTHRLPYPPTKGDKIRSHALLSNLAAKGTVHLGCFVDERSDLAYVDAARNMARGDCYFEYINPAKRAFRRAHGLVTGKAISVANFSSVGFNTYLKRIFQQHDINDVVVFGSAMAPSLFDASFKPHRVLFDMVDVDSDKWRQYSEASTGFLKWLYRREATIVEEIERSAAKLFGKTLLVSEFEANSFRKIAPESASKIASLTNGVDFSFFSPAEFENPFSEAECPIVMTGHMGYRPNYEGALWFAREILPHLKKSVPNIRAYFVGASPPALLRAAAGPSIVVTGSVLDVRPYLQHAKAVIAPLQIARGVQNKVLEALAMEKPVIATSQATRGLGVRSGAHLWIANDAKQFTNAVLTAVKDVESKKIARAGRDYVLQYHCWSSLLGALDAELDAIKSAPNSKLREKDMVRPAMQKAILETPPWR